MAGEASRVGPAAAAKLLSSGMAVLGTYLIAQMSVWLVLPGIILSYAGLIGLTLADRLRA